MADKKPTQHRTGPKAAVHDAFYGAGAHPADAYPLPKGEALTANRLPKNQPEPYTTSGSGKRRAKASKRSVR